MSDDWGNDWSGAGAGGASEAGGFGTESSGNLQFGSKGRDRPFRERNDGAGGGGGGDRACFNCNQTGHMSRECPEPKKERGGGGGDRACFNCKQTGHMSRDCPEPRKERSGGGGGFGSGGGGGGGGGFGFGGGSGAEGGAEGEAERPPAHRPEEVDLAEEQELKIDQGINFDRFDRITVDVKGADIKPIDSFGDLIKSEHLLSNIAAAGYKKMTPIQRYTIPALIQGHDLVGCAQTGSGKTAAFLLPVLQTILNIPDLDSQYGQDCQRPYCIIMAPTRELARQTYVEALKLSKDSVVKCQCIYGGTQTNFLRAQISKGTHILAATPGRLKDFLSRGWISLENLKYIILDEGDRLIDDGFVVEMRALFTHSTMPSKSDRQTMFFSATFKREAQTLAEEFMKQDYLFITVGMVGAANEDVKQEFIQIERHEKKRELVKILSDLSPDDRVIVFAQTKATADVLSGFLSGNGISCTSIHGDRHQSQREQALAEFKRGTKKCLVASPVGERGLDLPKVSIVINYDMPNQLDEYIHRIGRTGRIGNTGRAISFFDPDRDTNLINDLTTALKQAQQQVPDFFSNGGSGGGGGDGFGESNDDAVGSNQVDEPQAEEAW